MVMYKGQFDFFFSNLVKIFIIIIRFFKFWSKVATSRVQCKTVCILKRISCIMYYILWFFNYSPFFEKCHKFFIHLSLIVDFPFSCFPFFEILSLIINKDLWSQLTLTWDFKNTFTDNYFLEKHWKYIFWPNIEINLRNFIFKRMRKNGIPRLSW